MGAPLGGTTVGGQYGLESLASRLIVPPNGAGGGGRYFPSMVVVALGEPGVPVVCWAPAGTQARTRNVEQAAELASGVDRHVPGATAQPRKAAVGQSRFTPISLPL